MKRKTLKELFESHYMVPISIGRFFFEIYLKTGTKGQVTQNRKVPDNKC